VVKTSITFLSELGFHFRCALPRGFNLNSERLTFQFQGKNVWHGIAFGQKVEQRLKLMKISKSHCSRFEFQSLDFLSRVTFSARVVKQSYRGDGVEELTKRENWTMLVLRSIEDLSLCPIDQKKAEEIMPWLGKRTQIVCAQTFISFANSYFSSSARERPRSMRKWEKKSTDPLYLSFPSPNPLRFGSFISYALG